jgi:hypothetical protein
MHLLMNKTHVVEKVQVNVEFPQVVLFSASFCSEREKALAKRVKPKHFNIITFVLTADKFYSCCFKSTSSYELTTLELFASLHNFHDIQKRLEIPK